MNKISFIGWRPWLHQDSISTPEPISKHLPEWYKEADRFVKDPNTNEYAIDPDGGKIPNWKACPALFDIMTTGYTLKTPCDIKFYLNDKNRLTCYIESDSHKEFCTDREPLEGFYQPDGYYLEHFAWYPEWGIKLPEGYSALLINPMNRFDLPFVSTVGIVDLDKVNLMGTVPFFIKEGWTGTIPAGTPYLQVFPFKRENWESNLEFKTYEEIKDGIVNNWKQYRVPNGGVYKNTIWERRHYK